VFSKVATSRSSKDAERLPALRFPAETCQPLPLESFAGGRLTCGHRQGSAVQLGIRLPLLSASDRAVLIVCGPDAGPDGGATGELLTLPGRPAPSVAVHLRRLMVCVCSPASLWSGVSPSGWQSTWQSAPDRNVDAATAPVADFPHLVASGIGSARPAGRRPESQALGHRQGCGKQDGASNWEYLLGV
jgi:hypothetical protein